MGIENLTQDFLEVKENSFFYSIFKHSLTGLLVVDQDMKVIFANDYMFKYFGLQPSIIDGKSFGSLFKCAVDNVENPDCENTCPGDNCPILKCIRDIFSTGSPVEDFTFNHDFIVDELRENKWFKVSGYLYMYRGTRYAILTFVDISFFKQYEQVLENKLLLDLATGTMNKYSLLSVMQELLRSTDGDTCFTVCMIDFDDFKSVNDQYGHQMGDKVLETFSEISHKCIRKCDILGRFGGEEFIFIFMIQNEEKAFDIIKRINDALKNDFTDIVDRPITFSAGVLAVNSSMCKDLQRDDIIKLVDTRLYNAKSKGKNCAVTSDGVHPF